MKKLLAIAMFFALTVSLSAQMNEEPVFDTGSDLQIQNVPKERPAQGIINPIQVQTGTVVLPNNASTSQNGRAPQAGRRFIRCVYIITPTEMTTSGYGAQAVNAIGWSYLGSLVPIPQSATGTLKVYLQNTTNTTYSKTTSWTTSITGMTLVANGTINLSGGAAVSEAFINAGGTGTSAFSTVAGQGVYVAFEYQDSSGCITPFVGDATVSCTNTGGSAYTYQSQTVMGTALTSSAFRAETKFSPTAISGLPLTDVSQIVEMQLLGIYPTQTGPVPNKLLINYNKTRASADNITVNVKVYNRYPSAPIVKFDQDINFYKYNTGDTTLSVDLPVSSIGKNDSIVAVANTASGENVTDNNSRYVSQITTANEYSYLDVDQFFINAVGVSTANGEMIAGYKNNSASPMNLSYINYYLLFTAAAAANSAYNVVVYPDSSTLPGAPSRVPMYVSPTLLTPATINTVYGVSHKPVTTVSIPANSNFYIGLRQGTTNAITAYQTESPIRKGSFFFRTAVTGAWNDEAVVIYGNVFRLPYGVLTPNFTLKAYLQGFYDENTAIMVADTVTLQVRSQTSPYAVVEEVKGVLGSDGKCSFTLTNVNETDCYYFAILHRNHIQTWSHSDCEKFDVGNKTYDFTTAANKAYGDNQKYLGGPYGLIDGDVNQDEIVDASDLALVENAVDQSGYIPEDLTGDDYVDASDVGIAENNQGAESVHP
ncbi:MAG: hypothetical protein JNJ56_14325 [Ignavibacteria bacterium]|nr:hypothetical protein [Ignavibacteria bacterium]